MTNARFPISLKPLVRKKTSHVVTAVSLLLWLSACQYFRPEVPLSKEHINTREHSDARSSIPQPVKISPSVPIPKPVKKEPTHTVVVHQVPVTELLFSLARDADLNLDIDSDVSGLVTLNAINQPLSALLERIVESTNLSYEMNNNVLRVRRDRPYLQSYRIDYINMSRSSSSTASVSTQIASTGRGADGEGGAGNNSQTEVTNTSDSAFWETIEKNIAAIIYTEPQTVSSPQRQAPRSLGAALLEQAGETSPAAEAPAEAPQPTSSENNPNIIINKESGIVAVKATRSQHFEIEKFIHEILFSTRRQVLIEATIAEVQLSQNYQAGIDWRLLETKLDETLTTGQSLTDIALFDRPSFTYQLIKTQADGDSIQATLSALETFGKVKIMSSPKVVAMNNQTALLKVVDNIVYFTVEVNIETSDNDNDGDSVGFVTYETEINTVPVGFVMSVTPFISENDSVTLNVRPTISRVIRQARDPNPALAQVGVISEIPVIQVREVESVLKVDSGNTAVMGGLMQDERNNTDQSVPLLSKIPVLGSLFKYETDKTEKTELVIFIRPVVIKHASLEQDFKRFGQYLPGSGH